MADNCPFIFSPDSTEIIFFPIDFTIPNRFGVPTSGPVRLTGFGEDNYLNIEPPADRFSERIGADGRITLSKLVNNNYYNLTLTFAICTTSEELLTYAYDLDKKFKLTINIQGDQQSGSCGKFFIFDCCYIKNTNGYSVGTEIQDREFQISGVQTSNSNERRIVGASAVDINDILTNTN